MIACFVGGLTLLSAQVRSVDLVRGGTVPGQEIRYWGVSDTTLDSKDPDVARGGDTVLDGGPGRTILIKFGDLSRILGPNAKIRRAKLVMNLFGAEVPQLQSVARLMSPWGDGPSRILTPVIPERGSGEAPPLPVQTWSSSWRNRRVGPVAISWQSAGANGGRDAETLSGVTLQPEGDGAVAIVGLEASLQTMADRWYENNGWALRFSKPVSFFSSQARVGRPRLVIEFESAPAAKGPDLSVVLIERKPEFPKYDDSKGPDVRTDAGGPVAGWKNIPNVDAKHWPADGDEVTYVAHVKNVGDGPSGKYRFRWVEREVPGAAQEVTAALQPGQEVTYELKRPWKVEMRDHRLQPIGFLVEPESPDACAGNNYTEIQEGALNIGVRIGKSAADLIRGQVNLVGSHSLEDWVQEQLRFLNDVVFAKSRFSFAANGVLERIRLQSVSVVDDGAVSSANKSGDISTDAVWVGGPEINASTALGIDLSFLRSVMGQIRTVSMDTMMAGAPSQPVVLEGGGTFWRGFADRYPGLMGGGDTRNEGMLLGSMPVPYMPFADPLVDAANLEATDLLSATDVAAWNKGLGYRGGFVGAYLYATPTLAFVRALTFAGYPIGNAKISFYQSVDGKAPVGKPVYELTTNARGTVEIPAQASGGDQATPMGWTLRSGPFGMIDVYGRNGVMLAKITQYGVTEWSCLKLWQLVDAANRGGRGIAMVDLRFNLPMEPLDLDANFAPGKLVTDSGKTDLAALAKLTDNDLTGSVTIPGKAGAWIELDLGRDRPLGEVRLVFQDASIWKRFDIQVYQTGQNVTEAVQFAVEEDGTWALANRRDQIAGAAFSVAYRGPLARARFIRLVNKSDGPDLTLSEIQVYGVKLQ